MFAVGAFGHSDRMLEEVCAQQHMPGILHTLAFVAVVMRVVGREGKGGGDKGVL